MNEKLDPRNLTKILVIDTDDNNRLIFRETLNSGYIILEANTGINGIDLTKDTDPDIIFIDIDLPDLNGFEIASRLQTIVPKTPLIAMAERFLLTTKDFGLAVGFYGYIAKPIDPTKLEETVKAYLAGKKEEVEGRDDYLIAFQSELAHRVEAKVRERLDSEQQFNYLIEQNTLMIELLQRRQMLLENAAFVGQVITSILDVDQLLPTAVDTICEKYKLYYTGIFLKDEIDNFAVLKAGYGDAGKSMIKENHKLEIGGNSMIGKAIQNCSAQIALDVGKEKTRFDNPYTPLTKSEIALPLIIGDKAIGAISIQSDQPEAFSQEDITAFQALADQLAIAINNAILLRDLELANQELIRTKTYEAIATATGEAIHWVGNKAAPIPMSTARVREDLTNILAISKVLNNISPEEKQNHPYMQILKEIYAFFESKDIKLNNAIDGLSQIHHNRLPAMIDIESIFEDLEIIENSANTILNIKEDLIGPARKQKIEAIDLPILLTEMVKNMGLPKNVVSTISEPNLPAILGDKRQIERVFINLVKNAWEALDGHTNPKISISIQNGQEPDTISTMIADNGPGIPPENLEKIWVSFFTTKKEKGGTGLGLSACMEIINQSGGRIYVDSAVGEGTTFTVLLPTTRN